MRKRNQTTDDPAFFIDRSLGRHIVPNALRAAGLAVQTLADRYPSNEAVADEIWIREVTAEGLVILMKDDRVRRKPAEQSAILDSGARAFVITNAGLTGAQMAELLVTNRHRILQRAGKPGPYIYGVYADRIERLFPKPTQ